MRVLTAQLNRITKFMVVILAVTGFYAMLRYWNLFGLLIVVIVGSVFGIGMGLKQRDAWLLLLSVLGVLGSGIFILFFLIGLGALPP